MTGPQLVGLGLLLLVVLAGLHWQLWNRVAAPGLSSPDPAVRGRALKRWLQVVVLVEVLGLVVAAVWLLAGRATHPYRLAWVAPAAGFLAGNALPLQLAVLGITRSARAAH